MSRMSKERTGKAMPSKAKTPKTTARPKPGASAPDPAGDWRERTLARMRALILEAVPDMIEERKWKKPSNAMGVPVWSHPSSGMVCTGETYKAVVKLTFAHGASLPDPSRLFNASLEGGARRAIDIREGETVDARAFKALIKAAAARDGLSVKAGASPKAKPSTKNGAARKGDKVVLLSGGNPRIAKADGDAPVQAYIAAMSGGGAGWKRDLGRRLDALIVRTVPGVRKAVKWNSPFYGVEGAGGVAGGVAGGWFMGFHVFTHYVKVTFFRGTSLRPVPSGGTGKDARWIDVREDDFDEAQMEAWVKQAAALPGWVP